MVGSEAARRLHSGFRAVGWWDLRQKGCEDAQGEPQGPRARGPLPLACSGSDRHWPEFPPWPLAQRPLLFVLSFGRCGISSAPSPSSPSPSFPSLASPPNFLSSTSTRSFSVVLPSFRTLSRTHALYQRPPATSSAILCEANVSVDMTPPRSSFLTPSALSPRRRLECPAIPCAARGPPLCPLSLLSTTQTFLTLCCSFRLRETILPR